MWETGGISLRDAETGRERASFKQFSGDTHRHLNDVDVAGLFARRQAVSTAPPAGYSTVWIADAATERSWPSWTRATRPRSGT